MGDDNPFEREMDLQDAEDAVRAYAAQKYPRVVFPAELFDAILLRREGFSRKGLMDFFVPGAERDIVAAASAPDMGAFIRQKRAEGEAHVAKYGTKPSPSKTSYGVRRAPRARAFPERRSRARRSCSTLWRAAGRAVPRLGQRRKGAGRGYLDAGPL
jgi:hypothetical protein